MLTQPRRCGPRWPASALRMRCPYLPYPAARYGHRRVGATAALLAVHPRRRTEAAGGVDARVNEYVVSVLYLKHGVRLSYRWILGHCAERQGAMHGGGEAVRPVEPSVARVGDPRRKSVEIANVVELPPRLGQDVDPVVGDARMRSSGIHTESLPISGGELLAHAIGIRSRGR